MNEMHTTDAAPEQQADNEMHLVDFLIVLAKHKKTLIGLPLAAMLTAIAISFLLPNVYKASTKLLPPQQAQTGAAALLAQLGGAAGAVAGATGIKSPNDLYVGMLKSRTVADKLIQRFGLLKAYDKDSQDLTRVQLADNSSIASSKDGMLIIEVEDKDRARAAQLANAYVEELLVLTRVLAVTEASQRRLFFERQLTMSKDNLANAEMAFKAALDTRGVISVDADSRAVVETVGRVRAQIAAKEIQLSAMQAFVTTNNPEFKRSNEELISLRAELSKLQNGNPALAGQVDQPGAKQAGLENIKVLREVKYHQMLYELLAKQYELARLDEAKEAAVIQVLDKAIEPERHIKPKRAIIVVIATLLALFAAIGWAFFCESRENALKTAEGSARWATLKRQLRFR